MKRCQVCDRCLLLTEVESEVVDKMKYIEETKETMDKNSVKLAELAETIGEIHTGETNEQSGHGC